MSSNNQGLSDGTDSSSFASIMASLKKMKEDATEKVNTGKSATALAPAKETKEQTNQTFSNKGGNSAKGIGSSGYEPQDIVVRGRPGDHKYNNSRNMNTKKTVFSAIRVNKNQKGNPLLQFLKQVPYEFNDQIRDVDYLINSHSFAIFLSIKYHKLHPEYIYNKVRKLSYNKSNSMLKILLVVLDTESVDDPVRELNKFCLFNGMTLIVCSSFEQGAQYLTSLKHCESNASKTIIRGNSNKNDDMDNDGNYYERVVETLTSVQRVNKTDSINLISKYGSLSDLCNAGTEESLHEVQGMGQVKIDQLLSVINDPFVFK